MPAGQEKETQAEPSTHTCVACPRCGQTYRIAARLLGRRLLCRHCRTEWRCELDDSGLADPMPAPANDSSSGRPTLAGDLPGAGGPSTVLDMSWTGRMLGRYRVMSLLGKGGMGVVWRAHDDRLRRDVALKILSSDPARRKKRPRVSPCINVDLFMQEARAVAKLQHPAVVSIYEVAEDDGTNFLALELMEGGTLKEYVEKNGPIDPRELFDLMTAPAGALAVSHRHGIIHRDVKPSNFMFDDHGHLKIMDFGLADVENEDVSERLRGKAVGSLGWIAPETARAEPTTAASDIYSFGLVMYYALTGRPWLNADSRSKLLALHKKPPPLEIGGIPELTAAGADLLRRCLAEDPAERFTTTAELCAALEAAGTETLDLPAPKTVSHVSALLVAIIVVLLGVVGWGANFLRDLLDNNLDRLGQPSSLRSLAPSDKSDARGDEPQDRTEAPDPAESTRRFAADASNAAPVILD